MKVRFDKKITLITITQNHPKRANPPPETCLLYIVKKILEDLLSMINNILPSQILNYWLLDPPIFFIIIQGRSYKLFGVRKNPFSHLLCDNVAKEVARRFNSLDAAFHLELKPR